ncbi:MAG: phage tail assembly protein [Proteobacteria bacterium]|nr:phage tail assembly protein [Pseudomonadota bacterium]
MKGKTVSKSVTIELSAPITGHHGQITKITLREPRYGDVMALGNPIAVAQGANGMIYSADKDEVIRAYIEQLTEGVDPILFNQLSLVDTLRLREAIQNFFVDARRAMYSPPATSSSSAPASSV